MMRLNSDATHRPGLAYQHAFDWLAIRLSVSGPAAVCAIRVEWQLLQLLERIPELEVMGSDPEMYANVAHALGVDVFRQSSNGDTADNVAVGFIEPVEDDIALIREVANSIRKHGRIHFITQGLLGRYLSEQRESSTPASLPEATLVSLANDHRYRVTERVGFHPPAAVGHHYRGQLAASRGRLDIRDRQHFAMRRSMVSVGAATRWSALVCLSMERLA